MSEFRSTAAERLEPEDQGRADFYALLARLFAAAPDAPLLAAVAAARSMEPPPGAGDPSAVVLAWDALRGASAVADAQAVGEEFQALFVGVGRSEVSPYASHYLGPQSGRPLAEIRAALGGLGLARRAECSELEDHLSVMLETMRLLVSGNGERSPADIDVQRDFCERYLMSWVFDCCTAISDCPIAKYYRHVASFGSCFLALERDSFAME